MAMSANDPSGRSTAGPPGHGEPVTFEEYATGWLENRPKLSSRTRADCGQILAVHLVPRFGRLELSQISPSGVRNWYEGLAGDYPARTAKACRLLRAVLNTAGADERIVRNPCRVDGAGTERSPGRPTATLAEVDDLAGAMPERLRLAVLLAAWVQLRRGEILGLRRQDIDLMHRALSGAKTRQCLGSGTEVVGPPKSPAGVRTIAIPPHIRVAPAELSDTVEPTVRAGDAWVITGSRQRGAAEPRSS